VSLNNLLLSFVSWTPFISLLSFLFVGDVGCEPLEDTKDAVSIASRSERYRLWYQSIMFFGLWKGPYPCSLWIVIILVVDISIIFEILFECLSYPVWIIFHMNCISIKFNSKHDEIIINNNKIDQYKVMLIKDSIKVNWRTEFSNFNSRWISCFWFNSIWAKSHFILSECTVKA
jgi:hypothetical protein